MTSDSDDEIGWWETTPEDEPELEYGSNHPARSEPRRPEVNQHPLTSTETPLPPRLHTASFGLLIGLISPWGWYDSGFQALRWSFQDVLWVLTDLPSLYSEWGMTPLDYIQWLMGPLLPLVFVTTFVLTWYTFQFSNHSQQEHEEFSRKASIFHLSFFGVWYLLSIITAFINWGYFEIWHPSSYDIGLWIAAVSGIGLHPTAYGLKERFSNTL